MSWNAKDFTLNSEFYKGYKIITKEKPYLINTFESIGLKDPFPKEGSLRAKKNIKLPYNILDNAYKEAMYIKG